MRMAITPTPCKGESAIGYVLRALARNGISRADRALKKPVLAHIAKGMPSKIALLDDLLPTSRRLTLLKISHWNHSRLLIAQVCLECIKERGHLKAQWQNPFLRHCLIHECALVSQCQHCSKPLAFDINLLHGRCTSPLCGKYLKVLPSNELLSSQERVHDAYLVAMKLINAENKRSSFPPRSATLPLLEEAADILNHPMKTLQWLQEQVLLLPACAPLNVELNYIETIASKMWHEWPALTVFQTMYFHKFKRSTAPLREFSFNARAASDIIGVDFEQMPVLQELELISTKAKGLLRASTLVDISAVYVMLDSLSHPSADTPLTEQMITMTQHNICLIDILTAIKKGELSITYKPKRDLMHSIYVSPDEFTQFCIFQSQLMRDKTMSIATVVEVTGIPKVELLRLIARGKIETVYTDGKSEKRIRNKVAMKLASAQNKQLTLNI